MNLHTEKGPLELPRDFNLNMERTNPFLSEQGDASMATTLPSTPHNLTMTGNRERIDRADPFDNKLDAILEAGPVCKRGKLVIDTAHRRDGICASFAIDSGDLYAAAKDKKLKEIFADYKETFSTERDGDIQTAIAKMQDVYEGSVEADYLVFPVHVAPFEKTVNGETVTVYQLNNEVDNNDLVWQHRQVYEGDVQMYVPDGYGIAPFLKLSRMVEILFQILHYEVTENCLAEWPFSRMAIVHNCSDCLCNPGNILYYRDLVPSCTLGNFLTWLNNKLHVQPVVDSETKTVKLVSMETMLATNADIDISPLLEGDFTVQLNPSKRIVLTPSNKIEGTEPAAATFDKLMEKYGGHYVAITEQEFASLEGAQPAYTERLVMRKATGLFYKAEYDPNEEHQVARPLGTNHFTYDRDNSEETEEFSQEDSLPLMICDPSNYGTAPFIGERSHAHTSYNGSTADDKQDIILVQAATDARFRYLTTGTTQRYIPFQNPQGNTYFLDLGLGLCPYDIYEACWSRYNTLLLNHPTHIKCRVNFNVGQILGVDMTRLKLLRQQNLLPVSASAAIGSKPALTEADFLLVKTFAEGTTDSPILPDDYNKLAWEITNNIEEVVQQLWIDMGGRIDPSGFVPIDIPDSNQFVEAHYLEYAGYHVRYLGENPDPGVPDHIGQEVPLPRLAVVTIYYNEVVEYSEGCSPSQTSQECNRVFNGVEVTFTYTAVENRHQTPPYDAVVEYLESTGTQYIDTGLTAEQTDVITIVFQVVSLLSGARSLFGSRSASGREQCYLFINSTGNRPISYAIGSSSTVQIMSATDFLKHTIEIDIDSRKVTLDGESNVNTGAFTANTYNMYLFSRNFAGEAQPCANARIYRFTISDRMDLIPVRVGNVGYMFDRVSRELFGNAGTGDFIVGPDIT